MIGCLANDRILDCGVVCMLLHAYVQHARLCSAVASLRMQRRRRCSKEWLESTWASRVHRPAEAVQTGASLPIWATIWQTMNSSQEVVVTSAASQTCELMPKQNAVIQMEASNRNKSLCWSLQHLHLCKDRLMRIICHCCTCHALLPVMSLSTRHACTQATNVPRY